MQKKKTRGSTSTIQLRNLWLPVIAGLIVIFVIFFLAQTLARSPQTKPAPVIELKNVDLNAYTSMLGGIKIDTSLLEIFPVELRRQLISIDTMVANRELRDAIARLNKLQPRTNREAKALIYGYTGFCYYELAQPAAALAEFKKGITLLETLPGSTSARTLAWLAFNTGYLFQYFSYPESAIHYYHKGESALSVTDRVSREIAASLFNNYGVALEILADTLKAKTAYLRATEFIDTTSTTPAAEKLRNNIHRLEKKSKPDTSL